MNDERIEALFAAVKAGDEQAALAILDEEPALLDSYMGGVSPIRAALYVGNSGLADKLAERLVSPTIHDAAALGRSGQIVHLVGDPNEFSEDGFTPLTLAAAFGDAETVTALIGMGADLELFSANPDIRVAPIHAAAFGANPAAISALVAAGADPNLVSEGGFTALHSAAQNGDVESVDVLLQAGADRTLKTDEGKTAADYARESGDDELASRL